MYDILNNKWVDFPVTLNWEVLTVTRSVINKGTKSIEVQLSIGNDSNVNSYKGQKVNVFSFDQKYTPYDHQTHRYYTYDAPRPDSMNESFNGDIHFSYRGNSGGYVWSGLSMSIDMNSNYAHTRVPTPNRGSDKVSILGGSYPVTMKWQYYNN